MTRIAWTVCIAALLGATACRAEDRYDIKVYPCPRAQGVVTIDGILDEPAWQEAPVVSGFVNYSDQKLAEVQTHVRAIYDDNFLYFGVVCDEPNMKKLAPVLQTRDSHDVFGAEAIEFFVDPRHDHANYFQFAVDAAGSLYDSRGTEPFWNSSAVAKTKLGEDRWTLEFAIPWKDLGVEPKSGAIVGFNVCRDRHLGEGKQWTNWSQTSGGFHKPEFFAHLVLSPKEEDLARIGDQLRKGDRRGAIVIYGKEGVSQSSYLALSKRAVEKLEARLDEMAKGEKDPATKPAVDACVAGFREKLAPFRAKTQGGAPLDASEWVKVELGIDRLSLELEDGVWSARLSALLSTL